MALSDQEQLMLLIEVQTNTLRKGLRSAGIDIKGFTDSSVAAFDKTGAAAGRAGQATARATNQMRDTTNAARQAATNLSFQLNDVAQGLMSGTSPFTLMVQQTTQITQALAIAKQAGGTFGETMKAAFTQFLNPMALVTAAFVGLTALAAQWVFKSEETEKKSKETDAALTNQAEAVKALGAAYGAAIEDTLNYAEANKQLALGLTSISSAVLRARAETATGALFKDAVIFDQAAIQDQVDQLQQTIEDEMAKAGAIDLFGGPAEPPDQAKIDAATEAIARLTNAAATNSTEFLKLNHGFEVFKPAFDAFTESAKDGRGDFVALQEAIAQIALDSLNDDVKKNADVLLNATEASARYQKKLEENEKALQAMGGQLEAISALLVSPFFRAIPVVENFTELLLGLSDALGPFGDNLRDLARTIDAGLGQNSIRVFRQMSKAWDEVGERQKKYKEALKELDKIAAGPMTDVKRVLEQHKIALENASSAADIYAANLAKINGLTEIQQTSLEGLAAASDLKGYSAKVAQVESGGDPNAKNPRSSASGLFQFTNKTFYGIARGMKEFAGMTKQQIMAQKNNVDSQKIVFEEFTRQNEVFLRAHGVEINDATRYLAHFLGQQGAVDIITGKRGASKQEIAANPFLAGMSNQQIVDWAAKKMGGAGAQVDIKDQRESTDLAQKEAVARGDVGKGYDAQVAKQETSVKLAELMSKWDADHVGATKTQRDEYEKLAKIEAERFGRLKGEEAGTKQFETVEKTIQALRDETAVIEAQTPAHEALAVALDDEAIKREANALALEKETNLRRSGTAVTQEQSAAILAAATAQVTAKETLKQVNKEQQETNKATAELVQQMSQLAQSAIGGFIQDLRNGVSAGDAFNNMLNRIIDSLINMALQSVFDPKSGIFSFLGVGGVGAAAGGTVGLSRHTDGRRFPAQMWGSAPRMQQGGIVGRLRPGEVPIIAHKGELIVPAAAVRSGIRSANGMGGGGGSGSRVTNNIGDVNVDMAGTGLVASSTEKGKLLGRQIQTAVQVVLVRESRPGGILRKGP